MAPAFIGIIRIKALEVNLGFANVLDITVKTRINIARSLTQRSDFQRHRFFMTENNVISLRGLELIITYRGANHERRDNLSAVLRHLARTYSDYQIWLIEADATPRFDWCEFGDPRIRHLFVHDTGPFPKARLVNLGALMAKSPIICLHDADMIANPSFMKAALDALIDCNNSDALCPFTRVLNVSGNRRQSFIESGDFAEFAPFLESDLPDEISLLYANTPGRSISSNARNSSASAGWTPASSAGEAKMTTCFCAQRDSACGGMRSRILRPRCFTSITTLPRASRYVKRRTAPETVRWRPAPARSQSKNWKRARPSLPSFSAELYAAAFCHAHEPWAEAHRHAVWRKRHRPLLAPQMPPINEEIRKRL
jgi:hypothetical protein